MRTIRTTILTIESKDFAIFLESIGIKDIYIGDYVHVQEPLLSRRCICYAYSEKSDETVAILTHITLKYGNLQNAYTKYTKDMYSSTVGQTTFTWTP